MAEEERTSVVPRLLVIDSTPIGSRSATGQVKAQLFEGWPRDRILQVSCPSEGALAVTDHRHTIPASVESAVERAIRFGPDVVYCRPLDRPADFRLATDAVLEALVDVPLVTHIMDDWPARLLRSGNPEGPAIEQRLIELLERSVHRFAIGDRMADALRDRYGVDFDSFANCVDEKTWTTVEPDREPLTGPPSPEHAFVLRYAGALADDMTYQSIIDVATAVDRVSREHHVRFELNVLPQWRQRAEEALASLRSVSIRPADDPIETYQSFVAGADACVLAYNFDSASADYVKLSVANKLPDYLGAGRPILAYGPADFASIELCELSGAAKVVTTPSVELLVEAITQLVVDTPARDALTSAGRQFAREHLNATEVRARFRSRLADAAERGLGPTSLMRYGRTRHAHIRESTLMASLLAQEPRDSLMIDVGAHHGSELMPFLDLGWRAFAFEPDPTNRATLVERHGDHPRLFIDDRAVSDREQESVAFYRSQESTGISTLTPFRDSHVASDRVDTIRLDRFCRERAIERIDYLKVDTEGHDLHVLRSLDWEQTPPAAIQAEFEDDKTVPLGYDFHDMADFLVAKGYDVWVSEWHPVVRYGTRHDWCRIARYPTELASPRAWGNFLAFRELVTDEQMLQALDLSLDLPSHVDQPTRAGGRRPPNRARTASSEESVVTTHASPTSGLRSLTGPKSGDLSGRIGELATAFQGLMLLPTLGAITLYLLAVVLGVTLENPTLAILSSVSAGLLTLATVGVGVTRARRERQRAVAQIAQRAADAIDRLRLETASTVSETSESLADLQGHMAELEGMLVTRQDALEAEGRRGVIDLARRLSELESQATKQPTPVTSRDHRHFSRTASEEDLAALVDVWGPRLGMFSDIPPNAARRQLLYLADRIEVAERRSIGRLATSTPDMLLRMLVARAAAREASSRGEELHVLEIGTLFGVGLGLLGEATRGRTQSGVTLTAVDPLDGYYGSDRPDILTGEVVDRLALEHNLRNFPLPTEAWRIVQATNREAIEGLVEDRAYGMVVIDGDHHHDEVAFDFEAFRPLMSSGCYVVFDDYGSDEWPDVAKFVDEQVAPDVDVQFLGASWRTAVVRLVRPPR